MGKSGNGSGNVKAFGQVTKMYADTYNEGDCDYWWGVMGSPMGLTKEGENGKKDKNGKNPSHQGKIMNWGCI